MSDTDIPDTDTPHDTIHDGQGTYDVVLLVEQALDRSLEGIDFTVAEREQPGSPVIEAIADMMRVTLVARDPARRVGKDLIDPAGVDPGQQSVHAGSLMLGGSRSAADRRIAEHLDDGPAFNGTAFDADPDLILDRPAILKLAAVPCVNHRAHRTHHLLAGEPRDPRPHPSRRPPFLSPHGPETPPHVPGILPAGRAPNPAWSCAIPAGGSPPVTAL